ncbi:MAG: ABC transporter permease [bacterium]
MSNRLFTGFLVLLTTLLVGLFLFLVGGLIMEFYHSAPREAANARRIFFAIRLSLLTATASAGAALLVGTPVAYFLTRHRFFGHKLIDSLLDLPVFLSPVALGAMLLLFFNTAFGRQLEKITGEIVFSVRGIIIAQFFVIIGLGIRLLKNTFEHIDEEYEQISRVLGASKIQTFFRVVLPLAKKGILSTFLLVWARAIGEFGATITLAGATPLKTTTIPIGIFLGFQSADIYRATIFILILIGISLLVLFISRLLLEEK